MAHRTVTISAAIPAEKSARQRFENELIRRLLAIDGIREVSLDYPEGQTAPVLDLEYDARLITMLELDAELQRIGATPSGNRAQVLLGIEGMVSPLSEEAIESALSRLPGVAASASFASRSLRVDFDRNRCALPEIVRRLDELGYRLIPGGPPKAVARAGQASAVQRFGRLLLEHRELLTAIVGAALLLSAVVVRLSGGPGSLHTGLVIASFVIAGWYTALDTLHTLRLLRFDIDVLMFAAAFGAALIGHVEEGALLLVLFAFGGAGEELAMDRARRAIAALAKLAPETATVRDGAGCDRLVRVEDLKLNDRVVVRPFDRVPADGAVESGASAVDQSPITGESVPVEKVAGAQVFAGTINGQGLLIVSVSRLASESTLAKIVKLVQEAQTTKSPTQVFTDRVERWYVPAVLVATTALIVLPPLAGLAWSISFYRAMAFLTAASPCALAIGTPAAVLSGIARAARIGVLVKGGVHLENLGRIRVIAFDKTGTLTQGRPEVTDIVPLNGAGSDEILSMAASVESTSTHPLARAIVNEARARQLKFPQADDIQQIPGQGVRGTVAGRAILVGRPELLSAQDSNAREIIARLASQGKSIVVLQLDNCAVGAIGLSDRPRENAAATLAQLKELGIARTIMLTGDQNRVAKRMAAEVGVDEYHAELLPQNKLDRVRELEKQYGPIAMVGDGVNDAPALACATVGIAMGGAGTDVAIETADVALMADDLRKLPAAIGLSRFSRRIIAQNLTIALGVIAVLAPLAAMGYAYLGIAVLFHEGSTVLVVLNSLRLLLYRPPSMGASGESMLGARAQARDVAAVLVDD